MNGRMAPTIPVRPNVIRTTSGTRLSLRPLAVRTRSVNDRNHENSNSHSSADTLAGSKGNDSSFQESLFAILDGTKRMTFVLDLCDHVNYGPAFYRVVFVNRMLRNRPLIHDYIQGHSLNNICAPSPQEFSDFKDWATSSDEDDVHEAFYYAKFCWSAKTEHGSLRFITAHPRSGEVTPDVDPLKIRSGPKWGKENGKEVTNKDKADDDDVDYFNLSVAPTLKSTRDSVGTTASRKFEPATPHTRDTKAQMLRDTITPSSFEIFTDSQHSILFKTTSPVREHSLPSGSARAANLDWTRQPNSSDLPKHIQFIKNVNWAATPLGPMDTWSSELRVTAMDLVATPYPLAIYWGPQLIILYNEPYIALIKDKHGKLMGRSYIDSWAEIWKFVADDFEKAFFDGQATLKDDARFFIARWNEDVPQETYFQFALIPFVGSDGTVIGIANPAFEKTSHNLAERRTNVLRVLGEKTAQDKTLHGFWAHTLESLMANKEDAPFVLLYSVLEEADSDSQSSIRSSSGKDRKFLLQGKIGVPSGHQAAREIIDLQHGNDYFANTFHKAMTENEPLHLSTHDSTFNLEIFDGIDWQGFGTPSREAVCCAINLPSEEHETNKTLGFLFMGLNPHRPYDKDYQLYVQLLNRQLATTMASIVFFEEEISRSAKAAEAAAKEKELLKYELRETAEAAWDTEDKFKMLADLNPSGLFIANFDGTIMYSNRTWFDNMRVTEHEIQYRNWMGVIAKEDRGRFEDAWTALVQDNVDLDEEVRMTYSGVKNDHWLSFKAQVRFDDKGKATEVIGCVADISAQKSAEHYEKQRMEEAVELKAQQERATAMTSHELRNPLGVVRQSADLIAETGRKLLGKLQSGSYPREQVTNFVDETVHLAATIGVCSEHQNRVVDDVLTVSKLDAMQLQVTLVATRPVDVATQAAMIFQPMMAYNDISYRFHIDSSLELLNIDWVNLDPSRVRQILINLANNAVKFTAGRDTRQITITLSASLEPLDDHDGVHFEPFRDERLGPNNLQEWENGEAVYIYFAVQDTGQGMTEDELPRMFQRFQQANSKTHVTYGGSGLGLYICRELSKIHGGRIGVSSEANRGSRFEFYIKATRAKAPLDFTTSQTDRKLSEDALHPTVLLVEDNEVNIKVAKKSLERGGCSVHVAENGQQCLDVLRQSTFWPSIRGPKFRINAVLLDQEMPVMDGLECIKIIRDLEREGTIIAHVPTIAITANAGGQIVKLMEAGMDDVVSKPFLFREIRPKIEDQIMKYPAPV
ncbi:uncharacterized protein KY384_001582 [Bacidia gigantensis]|uniref:uncharacterized protein n=1 Tax=Bacidia gigantensis TaxID=2732470 RepID=UPI001D03AB11|nr:uncharacterized protein KY384_001582 [Bacidia gigantensis]KAG8533841.1 hypothetical protein KY384_001582 [Bacidia gigantensis]